jgi:hypothetical protein
VDPFRLITLLLEIGKMKADMGAISDFIPTLFAVIF